MTAARNPWLAGWRPLPSTRLRLFCLPYAGGGSAVFHPWAACLPPGVELCRVALPGREARLGEPAFAEVHALVPTLGEALTPLLDLPFALLGHSMGALLGFELGRWLRARGLPQPRALYASGHQAPHLPRRRPKIAHLPEAAFIDELRRMQGTPEELLANRELLELVLPTVRADVHLWETYAHVSQAPLACRIVAYGGDRDPVAPPEDLPAWAEHTTGACRVRVFPGDHFFLLEQRAALLEDLSGELRALLAAT